jgi:hypothetical protein
MILTHEDGYKTSTLWTALSTINPFFNIRIGAELKSIHEVIHRNLSQKDDTTKKADVIK